MIIHLRQAMAVKSANDLAYMFSTLAQDYEGNEAEWNENGTGLILDAVNEVLGDFALDQELTPKTPDEAFRLVALALFGAAYRHRNNGASFDEEQVPTSFPPPPTGATEGCHSRFLDIKQTGSQSGSSQRS